MVADLNQSGTNDYSYYLPPSLFPGVFGNGDSTPKNLTDAGGTLFFTANDGLHGREPWKLVVNTAVIVTAASSSLTSVAGESVTLSASVTPDAQFAGVATGSITFMGGTTPLGTAPLDAAVRATLTLSSLSVGSHPITAVYSGDTTSDTGTSAPLTQTVNALTAANLQARLDSVKQGNSLILQITSSSDFITAVQAVGGLTNTNPANPETVTVDLAGSTTTPAAPIDAPGGAQLDLTSSMGTATAQGVTVNGGTVVVEASVAPLMWTVNGGNVTVEGSGTAGDFIVNGGTVTLADGTIITGNSPAIIVNGGTVVLQGITAQTATNSPTIVVNAGCLVVRDSTIEESTGSAQAAILINRASVDLGTTAQPGGNTFNVNGTAIASNFGNVRRTARSPQTASQGVPHPINLGALTDTLNDAQSWNVDVSWGDGTPDAGFSAASTGSLSTQSHSFALPGTYTVTITGADPIASQVAAWDLVQTFTVSVAPSVFVLNASSSGALSLSGSAGINIPGAVVVDSKSASAISASGNTQLRAAVIDVAGGVQQSGKASVSPAPTTGVSRSDPIAGLMPPSPAGLPYYGSVKLTGGTRTIDPGIYSQISVSGNASLILTSTPTSSTYITEGGGLTVSGSASISGQNVFLYNAGSNYPASGSSFGGIILSGNGRFNLSATTTGTYAGILIFQSAQDTRALSFSGNAMLGISSEIYAPSAPLTMSGI